tara:strand:- start:1950 stop:2774 length:825 start_codon:yes stop_codon:yes gene_type:complete
MDGLVNYLNYDMGNVKIGDSVRNFLTESDLKDSYLAKKINVSRYTIRNWKLGVYKTARQQNLSFLANELKLELKIESGVAEFQELKLEEIEMADGITQDIIKNQLDHIETLKKENKFLIKDNEKLKKAIAGIEDKVVNIPQLDHSKLQAVVNVDIRRFHIISSKFGSKLGYSPIEILSVDFTYIISDKMQNTINSLPNSKSNAREITSAIKNSLVDENGYSYWSLTKKDGKLFYIRLMTHHISGSYYFCDAIEIAKKEFEVSMTLILERNQYFN